MGKIFTKYVDRALREYVKKDGNRKVPNGVEVLSLDKNGLSSFFIDGKYYFSNKGLNVCDGYIINSINNKSIVLFNDTRGYLDDDAIFVAMYNDSDKSFLSSIELNKREQFVIGANEYGVIYYSWRSPDYAFHQPWDSSKEVIQYTIREKVYQSSSKMILLCKKTVTLYRYSLVVSRKGVHYVNLDNPFVVTSCDLVRDEFNVITYPGGREYVVDLEGNAKRINTDIEDDDIRKFTSILLKLAITEDERVQTALSLIKTTKKPFHNRP